MLFVATRNSLLTYSPRLRSVLRSLEPIHYVIHNMSFPAYNYYQISLSPLLSISSKQALTERMYFLLANDFHCFRAPCRFLMKMTEPLRGKLNPLRISDQAFKIVIYKLYFTLYPYKTKIV